VSVRRKSASGGTVTKLDLENSKLPWHRDRIEAWLGGERIAPITVDMALTQRCNMKCVYCYGQLQKNPGKPFEIGQLRRLWQDFDDVGVKAVSLVSDGESTMNPCWAKAIRSAHCQGLDVALGTNGVKAVMTPSLLAALTYLRFNMSGVEPRRYEAIHGATEEQRRKVHKNLLGAVNLNNELPKALRTTIGIQMVLMPEFADQVLPLVYYAKSMLLDYCQIKHCSDDECGSLGVDYDAIRELRPLLEEAEARSTERTQVIVKWKKINAGSHRTYRRCLAAPFHLQISGSGLVAPCGMFFSPRYKKYHLGNLHVQTFKQILESDRYWEVMDHLASSDFNAQTQCGCLCLQDSSNIFLNEVKENGLPPEPLGLAPLHVNFL
jgi:MoaA/NifB/PqqE/SkfB family radical SAM enzyme